MKELSYWISLKSDLLSIWRGKEKVLNERTRGAFARFGREGLDIGIAEKRTEKIFIED